MMGTLDGGREGWVASSVRAPNMCGVVGGTRFHPRHTAARVWIVILWFLSSSTTTRTKLPSC